MIKLLNKINTFELDNKKLLAIILCSLFILYIDLNFLMKTQLKSLGALNKKITQLKKDLGAFKKDSTTIQDLKNKKATPLLKAKKLISDEQAVSLLQDISNLANKNDIAVIHLKPSKDLSGSPQAKAPGIENSVPLTISLELTCGYHNLGRFINDLENSTIFIAVQEIKIASQSQDYLRQRVSLILRTYVKK
jgi:Tfp pilus assembly protein PilO